MKTVSQISLGAIDSGRGAATGVKVPLELSKRYRRCAGGEVLAERIERALADRPLVLLSRGSPAFQVWQEDGRAQTLTFDGRRVVIQDDCATRYGGAGVSAFNWATIARAMAMRYARFDADARALVIMPSGVDHETMCPAIEFVRPENWGFEKTGRGYQWTGHGLFNTTGLPTSPPPGSTVTRPRFHDVFDDMCGEQLGGDRGDPIRCIPELKRLRATAEVAGARGSLGERLCFDLAVALGRCRLVGAALGIGDFTLAAAAARLAAKRAIEVLKWELEFTSTLPAELSARRTYGERDFVLERLEARMDLWAVGVALAEAEEAAGGQEGRSEGQVGLSRSMRVVRSMTGRVDGNLQHHLKLLRTAAGTYLLANWRRLLAQGYGGAGEAPEALPWWLDGCIG